VPLQYLYIDEVQDLTPAQLLLFKYLCTNPHGFLFAGDTARESSYRVDQCSDHATLIADLLLLLLLLLLWLLIPTETINPGASFRFQEVRDLFYKHYVLPKHVLLKRVKQAASEPTPAEEEEDKGSHHDDFAIAHSPRRPRARSRKGGRGSRRAVELSGRRARILARQLALGAKNGDSPAKATDEPEEGRRDALVPEIHHLHKNFRSHSGVRALSVYTYLIHT
jgi:hypothetical protein